MQIILKLAIFASKKSGHFIFPKKIWNTKSPRIGGLKRCLSRLPAIYQSAEALESGHIGEEMFQALQQCCEARVLGWWMWCDSCFGKKNDLWEFIYIVYMFDIWYMISIWYIYIYRLWILCKYLYECLRYECMCCFLHFFRRSMNMIFIAFFPRRVEFIRINLPLHREFDIKKIRKQGQKRTTPDARFSAPMTYNHIQDDYFVCCENQGIFYLAGAMLGSSAYSRNPHKRKGSPFTSANLPSECLSRSGFT